MTDPTARPRSRWWRRWLLLSLLVFGSLAVASPAAAHLDIASVDPADGSVMEDPSGAITLTFTQAAMPSGSGFTLYDAQGSKVRVDAESSRGERVWRVRPAEALAPGGRYGLTWKVAAGDAHPKSGTMTFKVAGRAPAAEGGAAPGPDAAAPATSHPANADGSHTGAAGTHPTPGSSAHAGMPGHTAPPGAAGGEPGADLVAAGAGGGDALDAALASEDAGQATLSAAGGVARWISYAGVLIAVGALVVVVTTLVGSEGDVRLAEQVVLVAAGLAVVGSLVEGLCLWWTVGTATPWPAALAVGLRLVAGAGTALAVRLVPRGTGGRRAQDIPALPDVGGRHSGTRTAQLVLTPPVRTGRVRGVPTRPLLATTLSVAMLGSFLLDGHTATVGPRLLVGVAALAHTAAAAVWVGGVVLLATLLLVRARAGVPTGAGELAVRFSVPATAAVVVAGVGGSALALLIIDTPADLMQTSWGRVLLVKLGLVAVVAVMGYVNNRYALPALDAWRPGTARLLRRTVAAEATVMIAVVLATAVLVASQS